MSKHDKCYSLKEINKRISVDFSLYINVGEARFETSTFFDRSVDLYEPTGEKLI